MILQLQLLTLQSLRQLRHKLAGKLLDSKTAAQSQLYAIFGPWMPFGQHILSISDAVVLRQELAQEVAKKRELEQQRSLQRIRACRAARIDVETAEKVAAAAEAAAAAVSQVPACLSVPDSKVTWHESICDTTCT